MNLSPKIQLLIDGYFEGALQPPKVTELETHLRESKEVKAEFLRQSRVDAGLYNLHNKSQLPLIPLSSPETAPARSRAPIYLAIAALITLGIVIIPFLKPTQLIEPTLAAKFIDLQDCKWAQQDTLVSVGDTLDIGQTIDLESGSAQVETTTGAIVTLKGPSKLTFTSANGAKLEQGLAKVLAETDESKGFTLHTPEMDLVDISTSFIGQVGKSGLSKTMILDGKIDTQIDNGRSYKELGEKSGLSIETGKSRVATLIESGDETAQFNFPSIEPPSAHDFADQSQGNGVTLKSIITPDKGKSKLNLQVLTDGKGQSNSASHDESATFPVELRTNHGWYVVVMDLGGLTKIEKINTYSWFNKKNNINNKRRAWQQYKLYGYTGETIPVLKKYGHLEKWDLIARVNFDKTFHALTPEQLPNQQACSISGVDGAIGEYRYLAWLVRRNCFLGEFDVYGSPVE